VNRHQPRRGPGDRSSAVGLAVIGLCLAACATVAVAAAGEPLQDAEGAIDRVTLSPWIIVVPLAALCLLGMVGFTAVRAAGTARRVSRRSAWLTVIGFVLLAAALTRLDLDRTTTEDPTSFEIAPPAAESGGQSTAWPTWAVVVAGLVAASVLLSRRRPREDSASEPEDEVAQARRAIDDSLADLAAPAEPRQAVIACYARLLEGLEGVGAGRLRSEAPFEHMSRVLATLGVRPGPLERLTTLFAEARFSTHEITEAHRDEAERALAEARADLDRMVAA
jgi:hypothetical protein